MAISSFVYCLLSAATTLELSRSKSTVLLAHCFPKWHSSELWGPVPLSWCYVVSILVASTTATTDPPRRHHSPRNRMHLSGLCGGESKCYHPSGVGWAHSSLVRRYTISTGLSETWHLVWYRNATLLLWLPLHTCARQKLCCSGQLLWHVAVIWPTKECHVSLHLCSHFIEQCPAAVSGAWLQIAWPPSWWYPKLYLEW